LIQQNTQIKDLHTDSAENNKSILDINDIVPGFTLHIPAWGGSFSYRKRQIQVVNT
jgi:hypothetical protein